jgi:hypothetical protein
MKKKTTGRNNNCATASTGKLKILGECLTELRALQNEARSILHALLINPNTRLVRYLCERFHVLQAYFWIRYQEARKLSIAALGRSVRGRSIV